MTQWFFPRRSAAEGAWELSIGAAGSVTKVEGWQHTGIKVAEVGAGDELLLPRAQEERIVVPLRGGFRVVVDDESYTLAGRPDVFSGPTDVLYAGPGRSVRVISEKGGRVAVATAPAVVNFPTQLVKAGDVPVFVRGTGTCSREARNLGMQGVVDASKILVCEVITPAGNWSSYPPHKHDEVTETENPLEEIYYFEGRPVPGAPVAAAPLGWARAYSTDKNRPLDVNAEVHPGDSLFVPYGWHGPMAAAPGYDMYYLNVMAGPGSRAWQVKADPAHAWIPQTMSDLPPDARLPLGGR